MPPGPPATVAGRPDDSGRVQTRPTGIAPGVRARRCRRLASIAAAAALIGAVPAGARPASGAGAGAVGLRVMRIVERGRSIRLAHGRRAARVLRTEVRYPAAGPGGGADLRAAPPQPLGEPYPLVVFAHGFDSTPGVYRRLLLSWVRAGYVVAAPLFPLEGAGAPGGPDRSDLVNEPRDVSEVITRLLAASRTPGSPLRGLIDPTRIAVAGQSDGGEVALADAYSTRLRDTRIGAAVVMSGAEMSEIGGFAFHRGEPPLLAVQGTADTSNEPHYTYEYFDSARRPKFLLRLLGAGHLPPYTFEQPQLGLVERVTADFLQDFLGHGRRALGALERLGNTRGVSSLTADP
ncbi:MAG: hypothetical protein KGJ43_03470 [Acidobacteriota bacterium]|nr:hypothetical protein [Acidobacteriota bacterium]